jgi:hypothetical protein
MQCGWEVARATSPASDQSGALECRSCGAELEADAKFCHQCGAATGEAAARPTPKLDYCARCQAALPAGASFCPWCGADLERPIPSVEPSKHPPPRAAEQTRPGSEQPKTKQKPGMANSSRGRGCCLAAAAAVVVGLLVIAAIVVMLLPAERISSPGSGVSTEEVSTAGEDLADGTTGSYAREMLPGGVSLSVEQTELLERLYYPDTFTVILADRVGLLP